jgi:hypothetical protein
MNIPTARQSGILCRLLAIVNSARENQRFPKSDMKRDVEEPGAITNREIVRTSQPALLSTSFGQDRLP